MLPPTPPPRPPTRLDTAEIAWKWALRFAGLGLGIYEGLTDGRVYVLTLAAGMMGLPTVWGLGKR